ncbi:MAG TPA: hypothetical protein ENN68_09040 [Methanomicrobia archaeon]|nr:hypothetical protein [Methanomicrobia archaeon]
MYNSLRELGIEAERKGRAEMRGDSKSAKIKTLLYRAMTPIFFNIQTEKECYHFIFQKDGSVVLSPGLHPKPDINLTGAYDEVIHLLQTRDKKLFELVQRTGKITITTPTFKGREAVVKLREMFH